MAARFTLNNQEMATLINQFIVDGRWSDAGIDKTEASDLLLQYFKCLRAGNDVKDFVNSIYVRLQNTLMALRKDDFRTIQLEPPFSKFGRQNMTRLLEAWKAGSDTSFKREFDAIFNFGWELRKPNQEIATYFGGDGASKETAIYIKASDNETKVRGEYWYLCYTYGRDWELGMQLATRPDSEGKRFDILDIIFSNGTEKRFYFDITGLF